MDLIAILAVSSHDNHCRCLRAAGRSLRTPGLPDYSADETRKRIFAIFAASSGNLAEWFDFCVCSFCAIYFAPSFFPGEDPTVQLLNTAGVFAAGFLMRPIGGSAESAALGMKTLGHESAVYWYVTAMMVVVFLVALRLPKEATYLREDL